MHRRRFVLGAASAAIAAPLSSLQGCGGGNSSYTPPPTPVPASASVIHLPADQYLHRGSPTEWWWHTGTLRAGNRTLGFEINAAGFNRDKLGFTQIMLTDVANARHYQRSTAYLPPFMYDGDNWAEHDPTKDWFAKLGDPNNKLSAIVVTNPGHGYTSDPTVVIEGGGGALALALPVRDASKGTISAILLASPGIGYSSLPTISIVGGGGSGATAEAIHTYATMNAPWGDPTKNMAIKARLVDDPTGTPVTFDLLMSQVGPPFMVFGTGVKENVGTGPSHLDRNNYYYSLTRLAVKGTVVIGNETLQVTGTTWMDHEYGAFGTATDPVKWVLQDMQLDNGVCISNYTVFSPSPPPLDKASPSKATIQRADGTTYYVDSILTPTGRTWTSPSSGKVYYLKYLVSIPAFNASFVVESLIDGQEFSGSAPVYEGVAVATGTFEGQAVTGTAWNEQAL